jgi:hypothetical protein
LASVEKGVFLDPIHKEKAKETEERDDGLEGDEKSNE